MNRFHAALLVAAAALPPLLGGCGPERRGEPFAPPMRLASAEARAGEAVFLKHCHECHPGGAAGLGPPLNSVPAPPFLIRFQVRHGLGAMPAFDETRISAEELDRLIAYLLELRRAG